MALKKQRGNMYEWLTHMWPAIRGKCPHECSYCYVKGPFYGKLLDLPKLHLDEKELRTNLGEGNFIFVCHTVDMFAEAVPSNWIIDVLSRMRLFKKNKYLLQSKNPSRIRDFTGFYSDLDVLLGTTIETNRDIEQSKAPPVQQRAQGLYRLSELGYPTMVTTEPIMDFDLDELVDLVLLARPEWVNIGADSKRHNLPEPPAEKAEALIEALKEKTTVKIKSNLRRLTKKGG